MSLEVTNVVIRPYKGNSSLRAFAEVTINNLLVIKGFRVFAGQDGPYVRFPSTKSKDGKFYDDVYFKDAWVEGTNGQKAARFVSAAILKKYVDTASSQRPDFEDQTRPSETAPTLKRVNQQQDVPPVSAYSDDIPF